MHQAAIVESQKGLTRCCSELEVASRQHKKAPKKSITPPQLSRAAASYDGYITMVELHTSRIIISSCAPMVHSSPRDHGWFTTPAKLKKTPDEWR